jgi:crossover junction endodeoxyribonuclease RuvC
MRILGIDPGTLNLGYGVVEESEGQLHLSDCGVIKLSGKIPIEQRLCIIYEKLLYIIRKNLPDEAAIEEPFVAGNVRSALAIGRAQAVAMLAVAQTKIPVTRYLPSQVKQQVTDYGGSNKVQVNEMVRIQLGLENQLESSDTADALAIALCHLSNRRLKSLIMQNELRNT